MSRFANGPWAARALVGTTLALGALLAGAAITAGVALAGLGRLDADIDPAVVPAWFWYFRDDPQVRRWLTIGLLANAVPLLAAIAAVVRSQRPPLHGAARWASEGELQRGGLRARQGVILGERAGRLLVLSGSEHVALYAPTRSGKGVGVVIPNLLAWPDSVVVLDVKRENWDATAGFRAESGQAVLLFDPLDAEGRTACFNPLGHVDRTDPVAVMDELQKLAVMLFPSHDHSDPFWSEAARTGFIGVGALVAETPSATFSLGVIYRELTQGDPRTRLPALVAERAAEGAPLSQGCVSALADFCSASENTFASIKQTITARLNLWINPRVCAATDRSDFDLRDLRRRRLSLYLAVTPDNLARVAPLYNLLLQQLIDLNTRERPTADSRQVLVLLDEFARLGHAAVIARAFSFVAGYGLRLLPVLQSPAQLRAIYGPDVAEEILANCGVEIAFAPKELKVARDLSDRLGFRAQTAISRSRPAGLASGRRTVTQSEQRRALMLPQELIQLPDSDLILIRGSMAPVRARKLVYWRDRRFHVRLRPPPTLAARPDWATPPPVTPPDPFALPGLRDFLMEPLPPLGAGVQQVQAWVDRFIDAGVRLPERS